MNAIRFATVAALCFSAQAFAAEPPSLVGHWKSTQCEVRPGQGDQKYYVKRDFTYTKTDSKAFITFYADETCDEAKKVSRVFFTGPYVVRSQVIDTEGATKGASPAHFLFSTLKLTPLADGFAQYLNSAAPGTCGTKKWEVGKEQDVTSTNGCSAVFSFNACPWEQDVVKVVGDELFFGARPAGGGCNPDVKHLPSELQAPLKRVK
jgi:Adenomatosis polyposis coli down-regulated 1